jgi:hypothetical protein
MARSKDWTDEDRTRALAWVENKAKTGAVFRGQDETAETMLPHLESITDLDDFAVELQEALTAPAWKRLLAALRQRKHQADQSEGHGPSDRAKGEDPLHDFVNAVYQVGNHLEQLVRSGDIIRMVDTAREPDMLGNPRMFGNSYGWHFGIEGESLIIEDHPALSTTEAASDDGDTHIRHGAVRMRVVLDPVIESRRWINHDGAGLDGPLCLPDTWQHCAQAIIGAVESVHREREAITAHVRALGAKVEPEPEPERFAELRAIVESWQDEAPTPVDNVIVTQSPESDIRHVTENEPGLSDAALRDILSQVKAERWQQEPETGTGGSSASRRSYPIEVQMMAVKLTDEGLSSREVREAILRDQGRAPSVSNMAKLVKRWREAAEADA